MTGPPDGCDHDRCRELRIYAERIHREELTNMDRLVIRANLLDLIDALHVISRGE